jgi:hypothetical protein
MGRSWCVVHIRGESKTVEALVQLGRRHFIDAPPDRRFRTEGNRTKGEEGFLIAGRLRHQPAVFLQRREMIIRRSKAIRVTSAKPHVI